MVRNAFRKPTDEEIDNVSKYMQIIYLCGYIKARFLFPFFYAVGTVLLVSSVFEKSISQAAAGIVCVLAATLLLVHTVWAKAQMSMFQSGDFLVADGKSTRKEYSNTPGMCHIVFVFDNGQAYDRIFEVDHIDLTTETPLLLVWAGEDIDKREPEKNDFMKAFTPFMLQNPHRLYHKRKKRRNRKRRFLCQ